MLSSRFSRLTGPLIGLLLVVCPSVSHAEGETAFERIVYAYEAARIALINDTDEGVAERGREMVAVLDDLAADFSPQKAGIDAAQSGQVRSLLPVLRAAAASLAGASDLTASRDAFYELSKPLVRWRQAAVVEVPAVAYCPMAKRSWLQPEGDLSNPYYGQSMLTCGEIVSEPS